MSITKRPGVGGNSNTRQLSRRGENVINKADLDPNSRNGRRIMARLRAKHGDAVIDAELARLRALTERDPAPDHVEGKVRYCHLCHGKLKPYEYQMCDTCDIQTG